MSSGVSDYNPPYTYSCTHICLQSYGSSSRGHSRYGFSRESRDATLSNAKRVISQVSE